MVKSNERQRKALRLYYVLTDDNQKQRKNEKFSRALIVSWKFHEVNCKEITDKNAIQKLHNKTTCNYVAIKHNCNEDSFLKRVILLVKPAVVRLEHFYLS